MRASGLSSRPRSKTTSTRPGRWRSCTDGHPSGSWGCVDAETGSAANSLRERTREHGSAPSVDAITWKGPARAVMGRTATGLRGSRGVGDEVLEVVVVPAGVQELGGDADGERVAADIGKVFAEQPRCTVGIAGGSGADHLDVMAFPAHLLATGSFAHCSGDGVEIGDGQPEGRVGVDREAQRRGRPTGIDGSLRLAVEPRRPPACRHHTAVILDRRPGIAQAIMVPAGPAGRWLHDRQVARVT